MLSCWCTLRAADSPLESLVFFSFLPIVFLCLIFPSFVSFPSNKIQETSHPKPWALLLLFALSSRVVVSVWTEQNQQTRRVLFVCSSLRKYELLQFRKWSSCNNDETTRPQRHASNGHIHHVSARGSSPSGFVYHITWRLFKIIFCWNTLYCCVPYRI